MHTLGEQLPNESGATGADREADADFFAPFGGTREQQIRQIDAGQQKDERTDDCEQTGEGEDRIANVGNEQTGRHQEDAPACVFFRMLFCHLRREGIRVALSPARR